MRLLLWTSLAIAIGIAIYEITWLDRSDLAWVVLALAIAIVLQSVYLLKSAQLESSADVTTKETKPFLNYFLNYKVKRVLLIGVLVAVLVTVGVSAFLIYDGRNTSQTTESSLPQTLVSPQQEASKPFWEKEVTPTSVRSAIEGYINNRLYIKGRPLGYIVKIVKIDVTPNISENKSEEFMVYIYYERSDEVWEIYSDYSRPGNLYDMWRETKGTAWALWRFLFQNRRVGTVVIAQQIECIIDKYGNKEPRQISRLSMTKETADKIVDWSIAEDNFYSMAKIEYAHKWLYRVSDLSRGFGKIFKSLDGDDEDETTTAPP